nr:uncharacterized protein LOC113825110 [Penaeus vannamei]
MQDHEAGRAMRRAMSRAMSQVDHGGQARWGKRLVLASPRESGRRARTDQPLSGGLRTAAVATVSPLQIAAHVCVSRCRSECTPASAPLPQVYLSKGHVHLIPLASSPASLTPLPSGTPSVMDAVSTVRRLPEHTRLAQVQAPPAKVDGYPGKISREQHVAHVYVPVGVAALLREYPTLVAPAVHAFCRRDVIDNKHVAFPVPSLFKESLPYFRRSHRAGYE